MNPRTKIRPDSIEQAHRALDALPEHRPEELTKTQAIQRLIVPIRATRSKGYSLAAIGKVLSECGIPITTGALRTYVSEANAGAGGKRKPKAKQSAKAIKDTQPRAVKSGHDAAPQPTGPAARPSIAGPTRSVDLDWDPAARSDKAAPSPGSASRPGFYVRPDRRDI
ncbi:MAG: hypothetical protein ACLP1X_07885 [Polyangiaceae bacterium]